MMKNYFETERLVLRKITVADEATLRPLLQHELMDWFGGPLSGDQVTDWIAENIRRYTEDGYSYLMVEDKKTSRLIGLMGLLNEEIEGEIYLGIAYLITPEEQGCGYAKEGLKVLLEAAFKSGAESVIAQISKENYKSRGLIRSLGFSYSGEYKRRQKDKMTLYEIYQLGSGQWEEQA